MCGIAGQINFFRHPVASTIANLAAQIAHRGPDDQGLWTSARAECVLGHARLSVIDLSPLGHQPMIDPETGNCIVFNGEIYNFQALRRQCEQAGDRFRSNSDTEVILALYRRFGQQCLDKLRGMFAFAIWDQKKSCVFLARDRVGKKPLNYALVDGGIIFCSAIQPLARHPDVSTDIDDEALELYLQTQYIPAPWTIYRQIRKLPPAHFAILDRDGFQLSRYWEVDFRRKIIVAESDALDGLEEKLTEAVRLRMISDVPLGALLSGGVDSSVVVALMAKLSGLPINTYSIGFDADDFNELPFAAEAAAICGTKHHPEILHGDVETALPFLAAHYGEPYGDSSAIPSFAVCRGARRHVTVAMNGDGGDELLGGYSRYVLSAMKMLTASFTPDVLSGKALTSLAVRLPALKGIPARVVRKLVMEYAWPELRSIGIYSAFWNDEGRSRLLGQHAPTNVLPQWRAHWFELSSRYAENSVDRMLWYDSHTYLPGDLLVKMDIASMHCGLETRSPLLDHEVIEYCASLPVKYKVRRGIGKYLLKRLAERYFPAPFVHRKKMGFAIPLAVWLRGSLHNTLETTLRDRDLMARFDPRVIDRTLEEFQNQGVDHSGVLWTLLMYGVWRKQANG